MSKILTAKEVRTEIYVYDTLQVDAVRFNDNGNILIADGEEAASCCLNCANPRCMFINEEASQCTKFHDIAGSVDLHMCPSRAISVGERSIEIDKSKCMGCGLCARACPVAAITVVNGKAEVHKYSNEKCIRKLPVTEKAIEEQERFLIECEHIKKQGMILHESDAVMKNIHKYVHFLNQDKQNIFVRNLFILLGNHVTIARKGNVYMRLDGFYQNENGYGVLEVETGSDALDVARAILDDIAVLNSRHGISMKDNDPLAVCLYLPNKRTDYWQVVKDIKEVTGIKIRTLTIGALLLMLWNHVELQDFGNFYIDVENTSIRKELERIIGRKIQISIGTDGILESQK